MSIYYLEKRNFEIKDTGKNRVLTLKDLPRLVLVYYFTSSCPYCKTFTPFFHQLPHQLHGDIKYAVANAENIKSVMQQSLETTTPIDQVPYVMLYNYGWPIERYQGPTDVQSLRSFLELAAAKILKNGDNTENSAANATTKQENSQTPSQSAPQLPKNPNRVCYLNYCEAYKNNVMQRTPNA